MSLYIECLHSAPPPHLLHSKHSLIGVAIYAYIDVYIPEW